MKKERPLFPELQEYDISLKKTNHHDWVESSFTTPSSQRTEFLGTSISQKRISFFFACISAILGIFFLRTAYLQVLEGRGFALLADRNKIKTVIIPAKRGIMTDRNGIVLVRNVPNFRLQVVPSDLPRERGAYNTSIETLSNLLGVTQNDIRSKLKEVSQFQPVVLADYIDYKESLKLDVAIADIPGVDLVFSEHREYVTDDMKSLSHVVGYTGRVSKQEFEEKHGEYGFNDSIGKDGLEASYESALRGVFGKRDIEVDALGSEKSIISEDTPRDGSNLVLSLDAKLQNKAESVLKDMMRVANKRSGVVIISHPNSGEILALASFPTFDNNVFAKGIGGDEYQKLLQDSDKPLFNRALRGEYPSGSTIKLIVAAAALQEHIVTERTRVLSNGGIHIGEWFFPDWKAGGHGMTDVRKALAESVNTFFYYVGGGYHEFQGLGVRRLTDYFRKFGIGEKTGIDLLGERDGFLPTPEWKKKTTGEIWYIGDTYHIAIGQGDVLVTPLQIHMFTNYFANGGKSFKPRLVKTIIRDRKKEDTKSEVYKEHIVNEEYVTIVREGLHQAVLAGSGRRLSLLPVSSAGKTGTAQSTKGRAPHAWFTGWAPYENPEVSITVLIDEGEEGSRTAVPVAYDILKWYFEQKNVDLSNIK